MKVINITSKYLVSTYLPGTIPSCYYELNLFNSTNNLKK